MTTRADELNRLVKEMMPYLRTIREQDINALLAASRLSTTQVLGAPSWDALRIVGNQLFFDWSNVPGAAYYELYQNSVASETGMSLVKITPASQYTMPFNASTSELIVNGGFESGDFVGWTADSGWQVSSADKYAGVYSAYASEMSGHGYTLTCESNYYPISPGKSYAISFWVKVPWCSTGSFSLSIEWTDTINPVPPLGASVMLTSVYTTTSAVASWLNVTANVTPPGGMNYLRVYMSANGGGGGVTVYVDDISVIGLNTVTTSPYFAVRAVNAATFGPLSSWLLPTRAMATVGDPSVDHSQVDYASASFQSSNFVAGAAGYRASPNGIEGACVVAASAPATPFAGLLWFDTAAQAFKVWTP